MWVNCIVLWFLLIGDLLLIRYRFFTPVKWVRRNCLGSICPQWSYSRGLFSTPLLSVNCLNLFLQCCKSYLQLKNGWNTSGFLRNYSNSRPTLKNTILIFLKLYLLVDLFRIISFTMVYFNWVKYLLACLWAFCVLCLLGMWLYGSYTTGAMACVCSVALCSISTFMSVGKQISSSASMCVQLAEYFVTHSCISCCICWRHSLKFAFLLERLLKNSYLY